MPFLDRDLTLRLMQSQYGVATAVARGEKPPNAVRLLSQQTGIPRRSLSNVVHGHDPVAEWRLVRIADALGVKPDVLKLADPPQPKPDPPTPKVEPVRPPARRGPKAPPRGKTEVAA